MSQPAFDFGDTELDDATNPTYSVGELADAINDTLRRGFSDGVWVRGEITGWSDRGQHAYFTLVDDATDPMALATAGARQRSTSSSSPTFECDCGRCCRSTDSASVTA